MIVSLTIFFMILIAWSLYSIFLCMCDESLCIYGQDDFLLKMAKIYWLFILGSFCLLVLWCISYAITVGVVCVSTKGDNEICEKKG